MSNQTQWKMIHLLNTVSQPALTVDELMAAGVDCYADTVYPLTSTAVVHFDGTRYTLSPAAVAMLQTFVVANRRWPADKDLRVDYPEVFVIMPFSQPWSSAIYDGAIRPAVEEAGLTCVRGDEPARIGDLMKTVWEAILQAGLVIADVSALNANVFYELGLAHALGKDTFILKQQDANVPADFGGAHRYDYDRNDVPGARAMLAAELKKWAADNHVPGVRALYR